jgi:hypothetical protein
VTTIRRFLVLAALLFWQGGLTFYSAVVIPIGARVLGSHRNQAVITREVVQVATGVGLLSLVLFFWDVLATRDLASWRRLGRQFLAMGVAFTWVVLSCLQLLLDQRFDADSLRVEDAPSFHELHRLYLGIFMAQWVLCLLFLLTGLQAWRAQDRAAGESRQDVPRAAYGAPHVPGLAGDSATSAESLDRRAEKGSWWRGQKKFRR